MQKLLHVECHFEALLMKSGTGAGVGRASYPGDLSSRMRISVRYTLIAGSTNCAFIAANSLVATTHAPRAGEVERKPQQSCCSFQGISSISGIQI